MAGRSLALQLVERLGRLGAVLEVTGGAGRVSKYFYRTPHSRLYVRTSTLKINPTRK